MDKKKMFDINLLDNEDANDETVEELSNGKGDDEDE